MLHKQSNRNDLIEHLKGRVAQIKDDEQAQEIANNALAFTKKEVYTLELSWGGPADGFKIIVDPKSKDIEDVIYYYSDWFSYDECKLTLEQRDPLLPFFGYLIEG